MGFSVAAFLLLAFCTRSRVRAIEESVNGRLTRTVRAPDPFTMPTKTVVPGSVERSLGSPANAEGLSWERPSTTFPSRGTLSPGFTRDRLADFHSLWRQIPYAPFFPQVGSLGTHFQESR